MIKLEERWYCYCPPRTARREFICVARFSGATLDACFRVAAAGMSK